MSPERARDDAFDDLLDAIEADEGYYLECPEGHGHLPPQRICPACGSRNLSVTPLPGSGEIVTYTRITVPAPNFTEDAPYVTAVAEFGPVRLTGIMPDADLEDVETGTVVGLGVGRRVTTGDRMLSLRPR